MQPRNAPPRSFMNPADVDQLIWKGSHRTIRAGLEVVTRNGKATSDISDHLIDGTVKRDNYADIHGTLDLEIDIDLPWSNVHVRPYQIWTQGDLSARFNLGVFTLQSPDRELTSKVRKVQGYDKLYHLNRGINRRYYFINNRSWRNAIELVATESGETETRVDSTNISESFTVSSLYPVLQPGDSAGTFEMNTYLGVINDLAGRCGLTGAYFDNNGFFSSSRYTMPVDRSPEFELNANDVEVSNIFDAKESEDWWGIPNKWVFTAKEAVEPVEGSTMYTYRNQSTGNSSIDAVGYERAKYEALDAETYNSLVSQGNIVVSQDQALPFLIEMETTLIPIFGHFDCYRWADSRSSYGGGKLLSRSLEYPLKGSRMKQVLEKVA